MSIKLYVGNISWGATAEAVRESFEPFGAIDDFYYAIDKMTGRPRGFCLITYANREDGENAISEMNGKEMDGRALVVNEARPKEEGAGGFRSGPRGGGGGGGFRGREGGGGGGGYRGGREGGGGFRGGRDGGGGGFRGGRGGSGGGGYRGGRD
jgi:RNA recognition motif-containing protein